MVVPVPAAVTDAVVAGYANANIGADAADMGTNAHTARSDTGTRTDTPDMGAPTHILGAGRCGGEQRQGKYRRDKRFHG
jgi:hypothetical protein